MKRVNDGSGTTSEHQCYHKAIVCNNYNHGDQHNESTNVLSVTHCKVKEKETSLDDENRRFNNRFSSLLTVHLEYNFIMAEPAK